MNNIFAAPIYETNDLALAAALLACGFRLLSIDKANPRRAKFQFEANSLTQQVVDEFWDCELQVDARSYFESIKSVKDRLYAGGT